MSCAVRIPGDDRSFVSLLALHLSALRAKGYSPARQESVTHVLKKLFAYLDEKRLDDVRQVRESDLVEFAHEVSMQPGKGGASFTPGSVCLYLGVVRGFFAFLLERGVLLIDPARDLRGNRYRRKLPAVLTEAEAHRLMNAPDRWSVFGRRDRAILELLYGTGIRAGECWRLDIMDVDLGQGEIFIRNGKGKKDRVIPVTGQAVNALDLYLRQSRPELARDPRQAALFLSQHGRRLSRAPLIQLVKRYASLVRIQKTVSPHLLKGGADVRHVQEILGHKKLDTTALYTRVVSDDLKAVFKRSHPRERKRR
jgi:site-specific recombinase XerD